MRQMSAGTPFRARIVQKASPVRFELVSPPVGSFHSPNSSKAPA